MGGPQSLSVLVVEEETAILEFIARILDGNGMRALLARSADEAEEIAQRGYVPIDLILANVCASAELINRLSAIRPGTRVLYMTAFMDGGMIRIQPMGGQNLLESITAAANAPLTFGSGSGLAR